MSIGSPQWQLPGLEEELPSRGGGGPPQPPAAVIAYFGSGLPVPNTCMKFGCPPGTSCQFQAEIGGIAELKPLGSRSPVPKRSMVKPVLAVLPSGVFIGVVNTKIV